MEIKWTKHITVPNTKPPLQKKFKAPHYKILSKNFRIWDSISGYMCEKLYTNLYSKPTDSFDYLLYNSSHTQTFKDSVPYRQFLRVRRVCSNLDDFDNHIINMSGHFLRRLYRIELLEEAAILARRKDRDLLLKK